MVLAVAHAATPWGIDASRVEVEVDLCNGLPYIHLVGLADAAVRESQERVRAAIRNSGFDLERRAVVVNLAPADLRKSGNHLDLPIAVALLAAHGLLPAEALETRLLCGELSLDGSVKAVRGALAMADLAASQGATEIVLPQSNAAEAALCSRVAAIGVASLAAAVEHLVGTRTLEPSPPRPLDGPTAARGPDLEQVHGQAAARRALEISAAGGHNLLLLGPPGSGKTLLSRCLPRILPPLSQPEALLVTRIQSATGGRHQAGLVRERPFRAPHSSISTAALIGGGSIPRPGEVTLAHHGVLFLDELPEFRRDALESLRQPLEDGRVSICRARARMEFPARFTLVAAMNPCKCGHLGDSRHECRCTPVEVERYRQRISGPLLDRIDLHVEVPAVTLEEIKGEHGEPSCAVAERVVAAREIQRLRFGRAPGETVNAAMDDRLLRRHCRLEPDAQRLLDRAFESLGLSVRALTRVLKVARTIADLARSETIAAPHVAEAIQYRTLDRRLG